MATEFDRYLPAWTQETTNGYFPPRTLLTGVPKERRELAQIEAELGMPYDDIKVRLERIDDKLELLISANAAQVILNHQAERNRQAIEGGDGILVRIKSLEDSRNWSDFIMQTTVGATIVALIGAIIALFKK